jgi:hypothetical protein
VDRFLLVVAATQIRTRRRHHVLDSLPPEVRFTCQGDMRLENIRQVMRDIEVDVYCYSKNNNLVPYWSGELFALENTVAPLTHSSREIGQRTLAVLAGIVDA